MKRVVPWIAALCVVGVAHAQAPDASRYTFSWPLGQGDAPRGGTTKGPAVTLDTRPSAAWLWLQEPGKSPFERDRLAIRAMVGDYKVTFDFLEVETFPQEAKRDRPYQSWGTERVYIDSDTGKSISLVHILEMRVVQSDGSVSDPIVTKHWRQTWMYEPDELVEYQGPEVWVRRKVSRGERAGAWSQTVYQVDESPRYAGIGRWSHSTSFSTWIGGDTWRPLPRREWSVRKDYQVLLGTNRHTINANGWVQEENNLKTVVGADHRIDPTHPYLAREYGVARYSRIRDADFAAADEYYNRTRAFWDKVVASWSDRFRANARVSLKAPVDQAGLFQSLFEYADTLAAGQKPAVPEDQAIRTSLGSYF
jgi:hypothetical protein